MSNVSRAPRRGWTALERLMTLSRDRADGSSEDLDGEATVDTLIDEVPSGRAPGIATVHTTHTAPVTPKLHGGGSVGWSKRREVVVMAAACAAAATAVAAVAFAIPLMRGGRATTLSRQLKPLPPKANRVR